MPDWLSDPPAAGYLLLLVVGLVAGGVWWTQRTRAALVTAGVALALLVMWLVCATFGESPREQAVRKVEAMAAAIGRKELAGVMVHLAQSFRYGSATRAVVQAAAQQHLQAQTVDRVQVWDFDRASVQPTATELKLECRVKLVGGQADGFSFFRCPLVFVREADGEWRLQSFRLLNPATEHAEEFRLPGL
jgi:hypothetical protein